MLNACIAHMSLFTSEIMPWSCHHRHCLTCNSLTDAFSHSNRLGEIRNRILPHSVRGNWSGWWSRGGGGYACGMSRANYFYGLVISTLICQELYVVPKLYSPSISQWCEAAFWSLISSEQALGWIWLMRANNFCELNKKEKKRKRQKNCWHLKDSAMVFFNYLV